MTSSCPDAGNGAARWRYWLPTLLAFVLRLEWMLSARKYVLSTGDPADAWQYGFEAGAVARSLSHGLGFSSPFDVSLGQTGPTAWLPPVYPFLASCIFRIFGDFSSAGVIVLFGLNCLFSALTCVPLYLIAEKTLGRRVAWLAVWLWVLVPYFNRWHSWIWDTSLSALLLTMVFWLTLQVAEQRTWKWEVTLGVTAGLSALTNPSLLAFLPAALGWVVWTRKREGSRDLLRPTLIVAAITVAMLAPWAARNRAAMGRWIWLRSNFGTEFYLTNHGGGDPRHWLLQHPSVNWYEGDAYRTMGEVAYNQDRLGRARSWIAGHPGEFARTTLVRAGEFWTGFLLVNDDAYWRWRALIPLSLLGLLGLALVVMRGKLASELDLGLILFYPLIFYVTETLTRYRHPLEPILLVLASYAVVDGWLWLDQRWSLRTRLSAVNGTHAAQAFVGLLLVASTITAALAPRNAAAIPPFAPQRTLNPDLFVVRCGHPDMRTTFNNAVELDYQRANVRVRIVDETYGWVFDRGTGDLVMSTQSLGCWARAKQ